MAGPEQTSWLLETCAEGLKEPELSTPLGLAGFCGAETQRQLFLNSSRVVNKRSSGVPDLTGSMFSASGRDAGDSAQVTNPGCYRDTHPLQVQMDRSSMQGGFAASQGRQSTISYCSCKVAAIFPGFPSKKEQASFWREGPSLVFITISHLPLTRSLC